MLPCPNPNSTANTHRLCNIPNRRTRNSTLTLEVYLHPCNRVSIPLTSNRTGKTGLHDQTSTDSAVLHVCLGHANNMPASQFWPLTSSLISLHPVPAFNDYIRYSLPRPLIYTLGAAFCIQAGSYSESFPFPYQSLHSSTTPFYKRIHHIASFVCSLYPQSCTHILLFPNLPPLSLFYVLLAAKKPPHYRIHPRSRDRLFSN